MNYWTKIHLYEESSSLWWNLIDVVNVYQCDLITAVFDENSLLWWNFINLTKFINAMKIYHCDEMCSLWWRLIAVMIVHLVKINQGALHWQKYRLWNLMKIYNFDENSSTRWKLSLGSSNWGYEIYWWT